jgi:hypothetical protein
VKAEDIKAVLVTPSAKSPKLRGVGLKLQLAVGKLTGIVSTPGFPLSITFRKPVVPGLSVREVASTSMVQIDCAATIVPQLLVSVAPETGPNVIGVDPLFVNVTGCGTPARVNVSDEGESVRELPV